MATATPSPTPNPDAMKYTLDVPVGDMITISSAEAAESHPLASVIFAGGGVASVFATADFVTVTREPGYDWDAITARVQAGVGEHL